MRRLLIKNAKALLGTHAANVLRVSGSDMASLPAIEDGWLLAENGVIRDMGSMESWPGITDWNGLEVIDATDRYVLPGWCDPHTHTVFAAPREEEFVMKIKGASYQEIAATGGGILNSARKLRAMGEDDLYAQARRRLEEMMRQGTVAVEIKSGYGLSLESELKMLRVVKRLKETLPLQVKATLLAAHALPEEYKEDRNGLRGHDRERADPTGGHRAPCRLRGRVLRNELLHRGGNGAHPGGWRPAWPAGQSAREPVHQPGRHRCRSEAQCAQRGPSGSDGRGRPYRLERVRTRSPRCSPPAPSFCASRMLRPGS